MEQPYLAIRHHARPLNLLTHKKEATCELVHSKEIKDNKKWTRLTFNIKLAILCLYKVGLEVIVGQTEARQIVRDLLERVDKVRVIISKASPFRLFLFCAPHRLPLSPLRFLLLVLPHQPDSIDDGKHTNSKTKR